MRNTRSLPRTTLTGKRVIPYARLYGIGTAALFGIALTFGAEFSYEPLVPGDKRDCVVLRGEIKRGDTRRLRAFVRRDPVRFATKFVRLASPGGDVLEAMKIGNVLRSTYNPVNVDSRQDVCASACFLIYVAATYRTCDGSASGLGIHRPYFAPEYFAQMSLARSETEYRRLLARVRRYLVDNDVPGALIERMFSLSSTEVYWLSNEDVDQLGMRPIWYDQVVVARCGLNHERERQFHYGSNPPDGSPEAKYWHDLYACEYRLQLKDQAAAIRRFLAVDD